MSYGQRCMFHGNQNPTLIQIKNTVFFFKDLEKKYTKRHKFSLVWVTVLLLGMGRRQDKNLVIYQTKLLISSCLLFPSTPKCVMLSRAEWILLVMSKIIVFGDSLNTTPPLLNLQIQAEQTVQNINFLVCCSKYLK